jgi:hypothetical protein
MENKGAGRKRSGVWDNGQVTVDHIVAALWGDQSLSEVAVGRADSSIGLMTFDRFSVGGFNSI